MRPARHFMAVDGERRPEMPSKAQFWVGSLLMPVLVGILFGGFLSARPTYSQDVGEGRTGNFAIVASNLHGNQARSQIIYVLDDRNEALYVLETTANKSEIPTLLPFRDLRELSTKVQELRGKVKIHPSHGKVE